MQNQGHSTNIAESKEHNWLNDPPFRWKYPSEVKDGKYVLECYCKRVQFTLTADPLDVKICHCNTCKALHGAPMQTAAVFQKKDACLTQGKEGDIAFLRSSDENPHLTTSTIDCPRKIYCVTCGSPLADEGNRMLMIFPSSLRTLQAGSQPGNTESGHNSPAKTSCALPSKFNIRKHIFYGQRAFDIPDGVEKWEGLDGKSRRMRDDGTIIIEEKN